MILGMVIAFSILRAVLFALSVSDAGWTAGASFFIGLLQDIQVVAVLALIAGIGQLVIKIVKLTFPRLRRPSLAIFCFSALWCFVFIVNLCSEVVFWREFETRPNFIAVDYLVYTNEIWHNIWQSYPVVRTLLLIACLALAITKGLLPILRQWQSRLMRKSVLLCCAGLLLLSYVPMLAPDALGGEQFRRELAANGWKSFFQAYFQNEIEYQRFYKTLPEDRVKALINSDGMAGHLNKWVETENPRAEKLNVMLVVIESLSRRYLTAYGEKAGLTPTMDRLYKEGVAFSNFYATGTRTVRGLEAVFLGVPPTPGQSIIRRPGYEHLYNLGSYLKRVGYRTQFLYGGYSVFDNMGAFFAANDMEVVDRGSLRKDQVTFETAWGVCDEDIFNVAIEQADKSVADHQPFFQLIMTTSNHRPYTYPAGKIDLPPGVNRNGAVKYTDYAIAKLLAAAQKKPWFNNTVFVFVADHNASVAGRMVLPVHDFPIPFVLYAPHVLAPKVIDQLGSQMDVAPTILDAIGFSYQNHFFGKSLLRPVSPRAFISTYQAMGYFKNDILTVLKPKRYVGQYDVSTDKFDLSNTETERKKIDTTLVEEAVAYYQYAAEMFETGQMKNAGDDKIEFATFKSPKIH